MLHLKPNHPSSCAAFFVLSMQKCTLETKNCTLRDCWSPCAMGSNIIFNRLWELIVAAMDRDFKAANEMFKDVLHKFKWSVEPERGCYFAGDHEGEYHQVAKLAGSEDSVAESSEFVSLCFYIGRYWLFFLITWWHMTRSASWQWSRRSLLHQRRILFRRSRRNPPPPPPPPPPRVSAVGIASVPRSNEFASDHFGSSGASFVRCGTAEVFCTWESDDGGHWLSFSYVSHTVSFFLV